MNRLFAFLGNQNTNLRVPRWQMHRGAHEFGYQENTLAAMVEAKNLGAQMVELDVRCSKDGVVYLQHDPELVRFYGRGDLIQDLNSFELDQLQGMTRLEHVLRHEGVPRFLNIEVKSETVLDEKIERCLASLLRRIEHRKEILFSSFNPVTLWKLQKYLPTVPRALLFSREIDNRAVREGYLSVLFSVQFVHLDHRDLKDQDSLWWWKGRGFKVATWTVNDLDRAQELISWGVDSVISDQVFKSLDLI